jgi:hypothetical protein
MQDCVRCSAPAQLATEDETLYFCSENCAALFFQPIGDPIKVEKIDTLKDAVSKEKDVSVAFNNVFPIETYAFKVMGYDRGERKKLELSEQEAMAALFPHQRLNRDFRGPWIGFKGGIIKAPTGAGKTATLHSILANYRGELVRGYKSPAANLRAEFQEKEIASGNLKPDQANPVPSGNLRIPIYVTKRDLVLDVQKDFWAQQDRDPEQYKLLMKSAGQSAQDLAKFDPSVNVMSYKTFTNMLRGANPQGRKLWAGLDINEKANVKGIGLKGPKTLVPVAYWRSKKKWERGNRPQNLEVLFGDAPKVFVKFYTKKPIPDDAKEFRQSLSLSILQRTQRRFIKNHQLKEVRDKPYVSKEGVLSKYEIEYEFLWDQSGYPEDSLWLKFVNDVLRELIITQINSTYPTRRAAISQPSEAGKSATVRTFTQQTSSDEVGWRLALQSANSFTWEPDSDESAVPGAPGKAKGDESKLGKRTNPIDRLVVVFDEAHLLFNPVLLQQQESADLELIQTAFRESTSSVVYFTSATIDMFDGFRMASMLFKKPLIPKLDFSNEMEVLRRIEEHKPDDELERKIKPYLSVVSVEGMRDVFPQKRWTNGVHLYTLSSEHAELVRANVDATRQRLMRQINLNIPPTDLSNELLLTSRAYDPDAVLKLVFEPQTPTGIAKERFPLAKSLLRSIRQFDIDEALRYAGQLTGRGIVSSTYDDDTINLLASIMQALGYRWYYLSLQKVTQLGTRSSRTRRLPEPSSSLIVEPEAGSTELVFSEKPFEARADDELLGRLGLHDLQPHTQVGESAPGFVVLSESLLVRDETVSALPESFNEMVDYARNHDAFTLPYKFLGSNQLQQNFESEDLDADVKSSWSNTIDRRVHYFPAEDADFKLLEEGRTAAELRASDGQRSVKYPQINQTETAPFFFRRTNEAPFYQKVAFPKSLFDRLRTNYKTAIRDVAVEAVSISKKLLAMAKQELISQFNSNLSVMRQRNLRYILLSRAFGQGIDVRNVTQVINTEPAPDRATELQRRGRFARPSSHSDLPFERWTVEYHTLVADMPDNVKLKLEQEDLVYAQPPGTRAVLRAIEDDPVSLARTQFKEDPLLPGQDLYPYELVRLRLQDPALTLKRLEMEITFDKWAVDREHNTIIVDPSFLDSGMNVEGQEIFSSTNYVIPARRIAERVQAQMQQLSEQEQSQAEFAMMLIRLNPQWTESVWQRMSNEKQTEILKLAVHLFTQTSNWPEENFKQNFTPELAEMLLISVDYSKTALLDTAMPSPDLEKLRAELDILSGNEFLLFPIERRLASKESGNDLLYVTYAGQRRQLNATQFSSDSSPDGDRDLRMLVSSGAAFFTPKVQAKVILSGRKPSAPRTKIEPAAKKQRKAAPEGAEKRPAKQTQSSKRTKIEQLQEALQILIEQANLSIGAASKVLQQEINFGPLIEDLAPPDRQQASIEQLGSDKLAQLFGKEQMPSTAEAVQSVVELMRTSKTRKSTINGSAKLLKSALLTLYSYGVMDWNRAVVLLSITIPKLLGPEGLPAVDQNKARLKKLRQQRVDALAVATGQAFQILLKAKNGVEILQRIMSLLGIVEFSALSPLLGILHRYTATGSFAEFETLLVRLKTDYGFTFYRETIAEETTISEDIRPTLLSIWAGLANSTEPQTEPAGIVLDTLDNGKLLAALANPEFKNKFDGVRDEFVPQYVAKLQQLESSSQYTEDLRVLKSDKYRFSEEYFKLSQISELLSGDRTVPENITDTKSLVRRLLDDALEQEQNTNVVLLIAQLESKLLDQNKSVERLSTELDKLVRSRTASLDMSTLTGRINDIKADSQKTILSYVIGKKKYTIEVSEQTYSYVLPKGEGRETSVRTTIEDLRGLIVAGIEFMRDGQDRPRVSLNLKRMSPEEDPERFNIYRAQMIEQNIGTQDELELVFNDYELLKKVLGNFSRFITFSESYPISDVGEVTFKQLLSLKNPFETLDLCESTLKFLKLGPDMRELLSMLKPVNFQDAYELLREVLKPEANISMLESHMSNVYAVSTSFNITDEKVFSMYIDMALKFATGKQKGSNFILSLITQLQNDQRKTILNLVEKELYNYSTASSEPSKQLPEPSSDLPQDKMQLDCSLCKQRVTELYACECNTLYCGERCQANDWTRHSKVCDAVRVYSD